MNLVCDTNVLISGLLWEGPPHLILQRVERAEDRLFITRELLNELADVLARPKLELVLAKADVSPRSLLREIARLGVIIVPKPLDQTVVAEDPSDDRVPACARTVMTDAIVSGDRHLLNLTSFDGIPVLTPARYLEWISEQQENRIPLRAALV